MTYWKWLPIIVGCLTATGSTNSIRNDPDWTRRLSSEIEQINAATPGEMGVYIKNLTDGSDLSYQASRNWYLSSTTKIPIAIVLLQEVERGGLRLSQKITLQSSDRIDGAGTLLHQKIGATFSLRELLKRMIIESDSTATNMLVRLLGRSRLNAGIEALAGDGFGPVTDITEVRREAYSELHPRARELTNLDFIEIKKSGPPAARLNTFLRKLRITREELQASTIEDAFERYYRKNTNSGTLEAFGKLLENLFTGRLLNKVHTGMLLEHLNRIETGEKRIKAGLHADTPFAQKTGTQINRICNVGIVHPKESEGWVVAACLENFQNQSQAEKALTNLGQALETALSPQTATAALGRTQKPGKPEPPV
ncbi:MAG TPA: serine hydrolase [Bdellovibrionales bacterium]|nr:MAG: hypothetical protein A2Z97_04670 [Bdellovibrionales bacterium GWB1_52_6]OFZ05549.1 MAG: hypothetical protein A2X97_11815 [Bdellovibrionales bacterium GWA1_52_35]OFZ37143.1 MAG: hypothetical protein A2070_13580 [Bdellovibrionales bacterium GWC1_52_8]HAR41148.1 serine hydrolase [Bdellovibrionales bacterium]HCM39080.1 serine hydrolase [Bdellovibrionales bacterium]